MVAMTVEPAGDEEGIQRDASIRFHELGTLTSVTRWINQHPIGLAEWLKNARRAYQSDRANVPDAQRAAVLLIKDGTQSAKARLGLLDVGGATLADLTAWSTWQDPEASSGSEPLSMQREEQTQGNGGKAYMYRMFRGKTRLLGVRDERRNCRGFAGPAGSLERGTPGTIPDDANGRNAPAAPVLAELNAALKPFGVSADDLPVDVRRTILSRKAFTLVEGIDPVGFGSGRTHAETIIERMLREDQSTIAIQQLRLYAIHDGRLLNEGQPLQLEPIPPYPKFERPRIIPIPEVITMKDGATQSTTMDGLRAPGRLILRTSKENMHAAFKRLQPRWKISYRTEHQMIGAKSIGEIAPGVPASQFVYGEVELSALEPDYVMLGRVRPNDGPLMIALDEFIADHIRDLSAEINAERVVDLGEEELEELQRENKRLDDWKNQFLPSGGEGGQGTNGEGGGGLGGPSSTEWGTNADHITVQHSGETIVVARGVRVALSVLLRPSIRDQANRPVAGRLKWTSSNPQSLRFHNGTDICEAIGKGEGSVYVQLRGTQIRSESVTFRVIIIDHVLLTPRTLQLHVGERKRIFAEVTDDDGNRHTDVLLNWKHDAADQLIVRLHPLGWVTGNRVGGTSVTAGSGSEDTGVWARVRAEIEVLPAVELPKTGEGFPTLKITGTDIDPETGQVREADPEQPALWQEPSDVKHNIWWLNLQSPDARFAFEQKKDDPRVWRVFHSQKIVEMVAQVHMQDAFTSLGTNEKPDMWSNHKVRVEGFQILVTRPMWAKLGGYVLTGQLEDA
jgi:hypothetical protein